MKVLSVKINDVLSYIGVNDRETRLFEQQWPLDRGVTYNSYIYVDKKTCLLDCVKVNRIESFVAKLQETLNGRDLDYIVAQHVEPDHSSALPLILSLYPQAKIVGNKKTFTFLENFYGISADNHIVVKEGDSLDLGDHRLTFYMTPMVHWPESMVSYDDRDGILFSQDIFGGFGALDGPIFDDEISRWHYHANETARYYVNIVGKYSAMAEKAMDKLGGLTINMICPTHGPIWRSHPDMIMGLYQRLARQEVSDGVCIAYGSMYGNTERMAEIAARALAANGVKNVRVFDVSKTHTSFIQTEMWLTRGMLLGSCTYNIALFPPMKNLISILDENRMKNHTLGIFGNYSWSGGAVKELKAFAEKQNFELLEPIVEAQSSPSAEDVEGLEALAKNMADNLRAHAEAGDNFSEEGEWK